MSKNSLVMLSKAAYFLETQEIPENLTESPSPNREDSKKVMNNHRAESKTYGEMEINGNGTNHTNGSAESEPPEHTTQNGIHDYSSKGGVDLPRTVNDNHDGKRTEDDNKPLDEHSAERHSAPENTQSLESHHYNKYHHHQRTAERANGIVSQTRLENPHQIKAEDTSTNVSARRKSPDRFQANIQRRSTSPASERGGDTHSTTKPMVLLQQPTATTLSSVGPAHAAPLSNPGIPVPTMHHPYLFPLMYQPGAALDPVIGSALSRASGAVLKDGEGHTSSPNGSPNDSLSAATAAGLHIPGLMYPLANHQAFLMGARPPGAVADISPLLLGQASNPYQTLDQYKRMLEGMHYPHHQAHLTDQYLKSLAAAQGLDTNKEALTLSAMAGRLPHGLSLAAQPGINELLLRYPEHWSAAAMGALRPPDGVSPRSGSPFATKRRTESPIIPNGSKSVASSYPYHVSLAQSQINSMSGGRNLSRSPAALLPQGPRSRSPPAEVRKSEADRSGYRSHSRDHDRDLKPTAKDLASASTTSNNNLRGRNNSSEQVAPFSVTDENGRKIPVPAFYGHSVHLPHGYPATLTSHHVSRDRSPSPRPRDERIGYRPPRDRSPIGVEPKRRSLESHYAARGSPLMNDRHNSRPASPTANGLLQGARTQLPLVNGTAETSAAAELPKHNPHLLLAAGHARSPNAAGFGQDGQQRNGSPPTNPYLAAGVPPLFNHHLISGLAGPAGSQFMLPPQYAQAIAASAAKGVDIASFYKAAESSEQARLAGLSLLHQQPLLPGGRPAAIPQEYVAALKAGYFQSPVATKDSGKSSPANGREKMPGLPAQIHPAFLSQQPPQAHSPAKIGPKPKPASSPQLGKSAHHSRAADSKSPNSGNSLPPSETRRYQSPSVLDRPAQEVSPKQQSSKPYRPNPMLRQHASDLERNRKRKMMEEEMAMREDGFVRDKHRERDFLPKDDRKDPKRVKQHVSEDPEEHFRRALGKDYKETSNKIHISGSVDEHFKKALGPMYEKVHTSTKNEPRDAVPQSTHVLPPYSVAVASATGRMYPAHQDAKEATARLYDSAHISRDRYYLQAASPHHNRKAEKSPTGLQAAVPTVQYPQNPPIGPPVRHKVKAKAFIPEAVGAEAPTIGRPGRTNSVGSKGSNRSMSGGSIENIPATIAKSPPASSPSGQTLPESVSRPTVTPVIPYTFTHQTTAANPLIEVSASSAVSNTIAQRARHSPTSSRSLDSEESTKIHQGSPSRNYPLPSSVSHRESTESMKSEEGKPST